MLRWGIVDFLPSPSFFLQTGITFYQRTEKPDDAEEMSQSKNNLASWRMLLNTTKLNSHNFSFCKDIFLFLRLDGLFLIWLSALSYIKQLPFQALIYRVSQKKWPDFTMSYLQKYWIWRLQIFYSNFAWVEIVYWKISWDYLTSLKFCWCLKISKFWAL